MATAALRSGAIAAALSLAVLASMSGAQFVLAGNGARLAYAMLLTGGALVVLGVGLRVTLRDLVVWCLAAVAIVALATQGGFFHDEELGVAGWPETLSGLLMRAGGLLVFPVAVGMMARRAFVILGEMKD